MRPGYSWLSDNCPRFTFCTWVLVQIHASASDSPRIGFCRRWWQKSADTVAPMLCATRACVCVYEKSCRLVLITCKCTQAPGNSWRLHNELRKLRRDVTDRACAVASLSTREQTALRLTKLWAHFSLFYQHEVWSESNILIIRTCWLLSRLTESSDSLENSISEIKLRDKTVVCEIKQCKPVMSPSDLSCNRRQSQGSGRVSRFRQFNWFLTS